jgi:hypothetical protein
MRKRAMVFLAGLLLFLVSCSNGVQALPSGADQAETVAAETAGMPEREAYCYRFMSEHMLSGDGGMRTNYLDKAPDSELATGAQVLSESMGLWMLYTVEIRDQALFDDSLEFVESRLDTGWILSYRYSPEDGAYPVNAFLDDMRVVRALLLAQEAFGGHYDVAAATYAKRLYRTNVSGARVYDFYDERYGAADDSVTLCYLDLDTMRMLARRDERWTFVYEEMLGVLKGGYLGEEFPLYAGAYSYLDGTYTEEDVVTVQSLLTILNLARVGECPQSSLAYIKRHVAGGTLYGGYRIDGSSAGRVESTAVYAICARIAKAVGDEEFYEASLEQMNRFQVLDADSEVFGAFANAQTLDLYAFDNLMALLAYRA